MKGQFTPQEKGTSPDKTSMADVAKVARGPVDAGNTAKQGISAPAGKINKLENAKV